MGVYCRVGKIDAAYIEVCRGCLLCELHVLWWIICVLWDVYLGPVFRNTFFYNQDFHKVIEMISKGLQG